MHTAQDYLVESTDLKSLGRPIYGLSPGQIPAHSTK